MLENIVPAERRVEVERELCFYYNSEGGYAFPCDENGNVLPTINRQARKNYEWCKAHEELFSRIFVDTRSRVVTDPAHGKCKCGRDVYLVNEYMGACRCDCGKWYNLFGQELLPPEQWEE